MLRFWLEFSAPGAKACLGAATSVTMPEATDCCAWPDLERRLRLRLRTGSPMAFVTSGRRVSPLPTEELAFAEAARDGFPRLRLPLPERGAVCPSLRPAADAPETDGCSPLSGSLTCLSIAPRGTIAAQGALLIFVGRTLPAPPQFAKFFLHNVLAALNPVLHRAPKMDFAERDGFFAKIYCIRRSFVYKPASPAGHCPRSFGE